MNVDKLVTWAGKIIHVTEDKYTPLLDDNNEKRYIAWLEYFKEDIQKWSNMIYISNTIVSFIANKGLHRGVKNELQSILPDSSLCPETQMFQNNILNNVFNGEKSLKLGESLIGSSDIIELLFGKFKNIEKEQASSGFTNLLLALPAVVGELSQDIIKKAMEETKTSQVWEWFKNSVGQSVQSKRKIAFSR